MAAPADAAAGRPTTEDIGPHLQLQRQRQGLVALWLLFAVGVVGTVVLLVVGRGARAGADRAQRGEGPGRVMLGPPARSTEEAKAAAAAPRCCTTEYGQADAPAAGIEAAAFGFGTPGRWGGFASVPGEPATDGGNLLRAAGASAKNGSTGGGSTADNEGPPLDGAAYLVVTRARAGDTGHVEAVLARLDQHFTRLHPAYPVVVYLAGASPAWAGAEAEARLRAAAPHTRLELRHVEDLQRLADAAAAAAAAAAASEGSTNASSSSSAASEAAAWAYARALWEFRVSAPRTLGEAHEWVLHLSEETLLDEDVVLDPFVALKASDRKLGYMTAHRPVGAEGLWAFGRAFAQQHQVGPDAAFQLTKDVPKALDGRWIAFHRSVVGAGQYQALIVGLASSNLTQQPAAATTASPAKHLYEQGGAADPAAALLLQLRAGGGRGRGRRAQHHRAMVAPGGKDAVAAAVEALPQEATVLTLGALLGLRPADFLQYQGLVMQKPPPGRGGPSSVEGAPPPEVTGTEAVTVSQWRDVTITASAAEDLQPLFDVRREGWLGADVATSFRLPPRREVEPREDGRYLWLFGDTLVGRASDTKRRRGAYFIHNSVAVLPVHGGGNASSSGGAPPSPDDVAFAWNVSQGGCPASVFVRKHLDDECAHEEEYLWPISGISASYGGQARVVVLAVRWAYTSPPGSAGVDLFSDDAFNFKILGTTAIVVDNPHEEPRRWRYRQKDIPGTDENLNWYSALLHEQKGAEVATDPADRVYLFGVNTTVAPGTPPQQWQYETLARVPIQGLVDLSFDGMEVWATRGGRRGKRGKSPPPMPMPTPTPPAGSGNASDDDGAVSSEAAAHWVPYRSFLRREMWAAPLVFPVFSETSVHYSEALGAWYGVVVDWLSTQILLYVAEELTGPWEAVPCYHLPAPFDDPSLYMSYAGKAHPELARGDEIILTYMTNAPGDLGPLFEAGALDIYIPRFVRLKLERAAPGAAAAESPAMTAPAKRGSGRRG